MLLSPPKPKMFWNQDNLKASVLSYQSFPLRSTVQILLCVHRNRKKISECQHRVFLMWPWLQSTLGRAIYQRMNMVCFSVERTIFIDFYTMALSFVLCSIIHRLRRLTFQCLPLASAHWSPWAQQPIWKSIGICSERGNCQKWQPLFQCHCSTENCLAEYLLLWVLFSFSLLLIFSLQST